MPDFLGADQRKEKKTEEEMDIVGTKNKNFCYLTSK